jgi:hypothetical protein
MKKGKPKPYVKKEGSNRNRIIAYVIIITMVFSGIYFGLGSSETEENKNTAETRYKMSQYDVTQVGDDVIVGIVDERPEVVSLLGEKARLSQEAVGELMNLSAENVYAIDGEASNSYVFFRFYTTDIQKTLKNLTSTLDELLGDYKFYKGYVGTMPGDKNVLNQVYLLGPLNLSKGSVVKILLLEKTVGEKKLGYIGFIKNAISVGPVVDAEVNNVEGFVVSGVAVAAPDLDELNKSISGTSNINYNPTVFILDREINETTLDLSGVELQPGVNATVIIPVNTSLELVTRRLGELKLNYTLREGVLSLLLPVDASQNQAEQALSNLGVSNITWQKYGSVSLPKEVLVEDMIVPIENNKNFSALLFLNATAKEKIKIGLMVIKFGDQAMINARQV